MADILKLKKKAADFEAKKQMDKALGAYREMIEAYESGQEDPIDIPLYNRVGDLLQKTGNLAEAVSIWEKAVDHYAEGGFYNPAIALCNKILRQSPGRAVVYYKLGKISAEKGFKADARQNFLEYAARMQKAGNLDEAFRALKEFADLVPEQDDVRLMLADQLVKADRKKEALDQLQIAYTQCVREGRRSDAESVAERMKEIDPTVEPKAADSGVSSKHGGLVFLDLDAAPAARASRLSGLTPAADAKRVTKAIAGLDLIDTGLPLVPPPPAPEPVRVASPTPPPVRVASPTPPPVRVASPTPPPVRVASPTPPAVVVPVEPAQGLILEPTAMAGAVEHAPPTEAPVDAPVDESPRARRESLAGLEPTSLVEDLPPAPPADIPLLDLEPTGAAPGAGIPLLDLEPTGATPAGGVPHVDLPSAPPTPAAGVPLIDLERDVEPPTTPSEIPLLDLERDVEPPTSPSEIPLLDLGSTGATPSSVPEVEAEPARAPSAEIPVVEAPEPEPVAVAGVEAEETAAVIDLPMLSEEEPVTEPEPAAEESPMSDFSSFGTPDEAVAVEEFGGFEPLHVESSEGVHALPLDDSYVEVPQPLVEAAAESPLPVVASVDREPPSGPRATSMVLANSVDMLRDRCAAAPEDWGLRRQLAEALLDDGQREEGVTELESTLAGFERDGDLDTAASVAEEIVRIAPTVIRYHQKRVEFAFRASDRMRLAEAYVELADALVKDGQAAKARVVYQRVLEIAPDDIRAQAALETIAEAPPAAEPAPRRSTTAVKKPAAPAAPAPAKAAPKKPADDEFVSLGDWLRDEEEPKSTRMVVEEQEPTGDEQADFADMLRKFKQGVSDNVDEEDHEAHYDLGVAYKEMGLLDEAISEFQKSLRGPANRVRAIEALGQCFVEKTQLPVAATILQRALAEPGVTDESLVGVLYLLGTISEELDLLPDAKKFYQRVFAVDIQFRDIGARLNAVEKRLK